MICSKCGFENSDSAKYCNECGAQLSTSEAISTNDVHQNTENDSVETSDASKTAALEIPPIFQDETYDSSSVSSDDFDFSPIDSSEVFEEEASQNNVEDTEAPNEYLVGAEYEAPQKNWRSGDTMEMPRIEGSDAPQKKEFRAPVEKKKSNRKIIIFISIILAIACVLGVGALTYSMELWGGKSIPDVVGMNKAEARDTLHDQGFIVKTMDVKSDDTENLVLLMDPSSGKRLSEGSEVVLHIATPRIIPDITNLSLEEMTEKIEFEGFEKVEYHKIKSDEAENAILSIEPVSGTKAQASTPIIVSVAEPYLVPDTLGKDALSAIELVQNEGFIVEEYYIYSDAAINTVVQSDPVAGTKLPSGTKVVLSIAKSLSAELIASTNARLAPGNSLYLGGTSYEIISSTEASYIADHTTQASVTVVGVATLGDGEIARGSAKQRTITFTWSDPYSEPSYY